MVCELWIVAVVVFPLGAKLASSERAIARILMFVTDTPPHLLSYPFYSALFFGLVLSKHVNLLPRLLAGVLGSVFRPNVLFTGHWPKERSVPQKT